MLLPASAFVLLVSVSPALLSSLLLFGLTLISSDSSSLDSVLTAGILSSQPEDEEDDDEELDGSFFGCFFLLVPGPLNPSFKLLGVVEATLFVLSLFL